MVGALNCCRNGAACMVNPARTHLVCRRLSCVNAGAAPPSQVIYYEGDALNIHTSDVYLMALHGMMNTFSTHSDFT